MLKLLVINYLVGLIIVGVIIYRNYDRPSLKHELGIYIGLFTIGAFLWQLCLLLLLGSYINDRWSNWKKFCKFKVKYKNDKVMLDIIKIKKQRTGYFDTNES